MGDIRSFAIREVLRELFHPAKFISYEGWFQRCKWASILMVTVSLLSVLCGLQTLALGQTEVSTSGVAVRQRPNASTNATLHAPSRRRLTSPSSTDTWTGKGAGDRWSDIQNWSLGRLPQKTDDVVITNKTHGGFVNQDVTATINNLTIDKGAELVVADGIKLEIDGDSITVNGQLKLNNTGGSDTILYIGGSLVKLLGSGWVTMTNYSVIDGSSGATLVNQLSSTQGIQGSGIIGKGHMVLNNAGYINANDSNHSLSVTPDASGMTNNGTLAGNGAGNLELGGDILNGSAALITGNVTVYGKIEGGHLSGGPIEAAQQFWDPVLSGVTIDPSGVYQIGDFAQTFLEGTITNNGQIKLRNTDSRLDTELIIDGAATLTGSGVVSFSPNSKIHGKGTLTNQQTINGGGTINVATLNNQGEIGTLGQNYPMTIQVGSGGLNNKGGTLATNGGTLTILGPQTVTGGTISVDSVLIVDGRAKIEDATLSGSGVVNVVDGTVRKSSNQVTVQISTGWKAVFENYEYNDAEILLNAGKNSRSPAAPAEVLIKGNFALNGTGTVTLSGIGLNNLIMGATGNDTLINNSTIQGTGVIGNNSMNLINAKGQIVANSSLPLIISMGSGNVFTNKGPLLVAAIGGQAASVLTITGPFANFNPNTGTLTGGIYNIAGTLQFDNANIVNNAANLTLAGQILNQNNVNGLLNFASNTSRGSFTLLPPTFGPLATAGTFTNQGQFTVSKGSKFSVGGSGNYQQAGGKTTVDGTLAVPTGGQVNATAGTLAGAGTFSGNVSVGNASGKVATFVIGDSTKQAGQISATNDYTQLLTGVLDAQIGGTTVGSQYSQLNVTSAGTLNGTLNIKLINNFLPSVGQTFHILTASSLNGTFSKVNGKKINSSEHFEVSYSSTDVVLTVVSGPEEEAPQAALVHPSDQKRMGAAT